MDENEKYLCLLNNTHSDQGFSYLQCKFSQGIEQSADLEYDQEALTKFDLRIRAILEQLTEFTIAFITLMFKFFG
eukprot:snap_masked-scaffold_40-processed-gene-2.16-mRNA-1 protein AED:1.00 eAED:1.00 QI:0/-1/0/0/-1/1/1/0/74